MMKQQFVFNDESRPTLCVLAQTHKRFDAMTIQISRVVDFDNEIQTGEESVTFGVKYVYEEIDDNDMVKYARYMGIDNIQRSFGWALVGMGRK